MNLTERLILCGEAAVAARELPQWWELLRSFVCAADAFCCMDAYVFNIELHAGRLIELGRRCTPQEWVRVKPVLQQLKATRDSFAEESRYRMRLVNVNA